jgi:hypothetical protein
LLPRPHRMLNPRRLFPPARQPTGQRCLPHRGRASGLPRVSVLCRRLPRVRMFRRLPCVLALYRHRPRAVRSVHLRRLAMNTGHLRLHGMITRGTMVTGGGATAPMSGHRGAGSLRVLAGAGFPVDGLIRLRAGTTSRANGRVESRSVARGANAMSSSTRDSRRVAIHVTPWSRRAPPVHTVC